MASTSVRGKSRHSPVADGGLGLDFRSVFVPTHLSAAINANCWASWHSSAKRSHAATATRLTATCARSTASECSCAWTRIVSSAASGCARAWSSEARTAGASRSATLGLSLTLTETGIDLLVTGGKPLDGPLRATLPLLGGAACTAFYVPVYQPILSWFPDRRGFIAGMMGVGQGLGAGDVRGVGFTIGLGVGLGVGLCVGRRGGLCGGLCGVMRGGMCGCARLH